MKYWIDLFSSIIIFPLLVILVGHAMTLIKAKLEEIRVKSKNELVKKLLTVAEDSVCTSVATIMQTYVDGIKKANLFDATSQQKAFNDAKKKAMAMMGQAALEAIKDTYGSLDYWLENKIEYYVRSQKARSNI